MDGIIMTDSQIVACKKAYSGHSIYLTSQLVNPSFSDQLQINLIGITQNNNHVNLNAALRIKSYLETQFDIEEDPQLILWAAQSFFKSINHSPHQLNNMERSEDLLDFAALLCVWLRKFRNNFVQIKSSTESKEISAEQSVVLLTEKLNYFLSIQSYIYNSMSDIEAQKINLGHFKKTICSVFANFHLEIHGLLMDFQITNRTIGSVIDNIKERLKKSQYLGIENTIGPQIVRRLEDKKQKIIIDEKETKKSLLRIFFERINFHYKTRTLLLCAGKSHIGQVKWFNQGHVENKILIRHRSFHLQQMIENKTNMQLTDEISLNYALVPSQELVRLQLQVQYGRDCKTILSTIKKQTSFESLVNHVFDLPLQSKKIPGILEEWIYNADSRL